MSGSVQRLPGVFPLYEDRDYLSEREKIIIRLLCQSADSIASMNPAQLTAATANQISEQRASDLIQIANLRHEFGLGSWICRLLTDAGLTASHLRRESADNIAARINRFVGYPILNQATIHALDHLQQQWQQQESKGVPL